MHICRPDIQIPYGQETGYAKLGGGRRHVAGDHFAKQTNTLAVCVISKPLTELPLNFEIRYAYNDFLVHEFQHGIKIDKGIYYLIQSSRA